MEYKTLMNMLKDEQILDDIRSHAEEDRPRITAEIFNFAHPDTPITPEQVVKWTSPNAKYQRNAEYFKTQNLRNYYRKLCANNPDAQPKHKEKLEQLEQKLQNIKYDKIPKKTNPHAAYDKLMRQRSQLATYLQQHPEHKPTTDEINTLKQICEQINEIPTDSKPSKHNTKLDKYINTIINF